MIINKKSISPIIATLLLVTISIVVGVSMYDWYTEYTQNISQDVNEKEFSKEVKIDYMSQDTLYLYNEYSESEINGLIIDGVECDIITENRNFSKGTVQLDFDNSCAQDLDSDMSKVVLITDKGTYTKLMNVPYIASNSENASKKDTEEEDTDISKGT